MRFENLGGAFGCHQPGGGVQTAAPRIEASIILSIAIFMLETMPELNSVPAARWVKGTERVWGLSHPLGPCQRTAKNPGGGCDFFSSEFQWLISWKSEGLLVGKKSMTQDLYST